jgi:hypothetical protein
VIEMTVALEAQYATTRASPRRPAIDATLMILPLRCSRIGSHAAWAMKKSP